MAVVGTKAFLLVSATACVLAYPALGMADGASIPGDWKLAATITYEPAMEMYIGKLTVVSFPDPRKPDAGRATYEIWGKYVYKKPQIRDGRSFTTDIVEFNLDCNVSTIADKREILQDADGKTVSDDTRAGTPKKVDFPAIRDLSGYSEQVNIAYASMNFTCNSDGD